MSQMMFYHVDGRVSKTAWCDVVQIAVSHTVSAKKRAEKINQLMGARFGVKEQWDKQLLYSIHSAAMQFDSFQFNWRDRPVQCGVKIFGERELIFYEPHEPLQPIKSNNKISVSISGIAGDTTSEWTFDEIQARRKDDYPVVALYNCTSFKKYGEISTDLGIARHLEKFVLASRAKL